MKKFIYISSFAAIICLYGCGYDMIKGSADASDLKLTRADDKTYRLPVPIATKNLTIADEKDLTGYWVGAFTPVNGWEDLPSGMRGASYFAKKINISIEEVANGTVSGHRIVAGTIRPFTGTVEKDGQAYTFKVHGPGDDKNDGRFEFRIARGDSVLKGIWSNEQAEEKPQYSYKLKKKLFNYDPHQKLIPIRYRDWNKTKTIFPTIIDTTGGNQIFIGPSFASTSWQMDKYNASYDLLTKDEVANLKKADLLILRSSTYARHGYIFKDVLLSTYYNNQPWYIPMSTNVTQELTAIEKKNIKLLLRYEKHAEEFYSDFSR